jgi:integrase
MGYSRVRTGRDGVRRYTAYYWDIRGRERSAGTFSSRKEADRAWQREETKVAEGRAGDPRRGRQTFERYVWDEWLPCHVMELRTRENYIYYLDRRIIPEFGPMRMVEILPAHVREWVTRLTREGVKPQAIRYCMVVLSAIFTTALNDQVTFLHPCKGVKTPPIPKRPHRIITPEQFADLYAALPSETMRLLVETGVESGLRWGELTELRPGDLDFRGVLTVSRVVVELTPRFHPDGGRFIVKGYPKDREHRRLRLSAHMVSKIKAFIEVHGIGDGDLLFAMPQLPQQSSLRALAEPSTLGLTEPNEAGRRYRHGTLSAYSAGKCRCEHCRCAYARYRAQRRAAGQDQPRPGRAVVTDGHIPRWWFRAHVWQPAIEASSLPESVTVHGLRHAHASWLLAGGADLEVVKERLGHASIVTTQKYLGTVDGTDETAIDALSRIRNRGHKPGRPGRRRSA